MMDLNEFEKLMSNYKQMVLEHGSESEQAENAFQELQNSSGNQEMTNEHRQILANLGILPRISIDTNGDQYISIEAWAEWYGVSVAEAGDKLSRRGIVATTQAFREAVDSYKTTVYLFGEDSKQAALAFRKLMLIAPPEFKEIADEVAAEMFDFPQPIGVDENGKGLYSLQDIASMLNIPLEEATKILRDSDIDLDQPTKVYRLH